MCFVDLQKEYGSVDRTLLWKVLARCDVRAKMIAVIRQFHNFRKACLRQDDGEYWKRLEVGELRQRCAL